MKKKSDPHWKYRAETIGKTKYLLVLCLFCGLMLLSALCMLYDLFPELRLNGGGILKAELFAAALVLFHKGALYYVRNKGIPVLSSPWVLAPLSAIYLLGFLFYYLTHREVLESGTLYIGTVFLEQFNTYYKTDFSIAAGSAKAVPEALCFWLMLFFTVFWLFAVIWQKTVLLTALPLAVLVMGLLVGKSPGWQGFALFLLGILLLVSGEWENCAKNSLKQKHANVLRQQYLPRLVVFSLCGLLLLTGERIFSHPVDKMMEKAPDMREFQRELEVRFSSMIVSPFSKSKVDISNRTPEYSGKEVITIQASGNVRGNLYLRNFYGTDYVNGGWVCDMGDFERAAENAGFSPKDVALAVADRAYEISQQQEREATLTYQITYSRKLGREAALPYFANLSEVDHIKVFGEGRAKKNLFSNELSVESRYGNSDADELAWQADIDFNYHDPMIAWYNEYALTYVDGSGDVPSADYHAWLTGNLFYNEWEPVYYTYTYGEDDGNESYVDELLQYYQSRLEGESTYRRNYTRLEAADMVSRELQSGCRYALELDSVPSGMDAVEYFLSESHAGYCMHFASAGTLMLRSLGIPARYASGYVAKLREFERDSDGHYTASVKDWNAHAWVEVYLDDIGWVPVEMTPGYDIYSKELPTEPGVTTNENGGQSPAGEEEGEPETENVAETEDESENESESEEENSPQDNNQDKTQNDSTGIGGFWGNGGRGVGKTILILAVILILVYVLFWQGRKFLHRYHMLLEREMSKRRYRKAVKRMNRRIYKRLLRAGKIRKWNLKDKEYEQLLIKCYPQIRKDDWSEYMRIVKAAVFSSNELTEEEAQFCYQVYTTCRSMRK